MTVLDDTLALTIQQSLQESIDVKLEVINSRLATLSAIAEVMIGALQRGRKLLFFGNGGSAADAQHLAAELVSRFRRDRAALPAIALTTDTSILTSIGNDYGFEQAFARQVEALGAPGDVVVAISTSGDSPNVLRAVEVARERGLVTIGLTGEKGGALGRFVDHCFHAPSNSTPRIQEAHIAVGHALCELIETQLFPASA